MQNLQYAFRFTFASFSLAIKHARLRKPWLYLLGGGWILLMVWFIPLFTVIIVFRSHPLGLLLVGLLGGFMLISLLVWGEIAAVQTCRAFFKLINLADNTTEFEDKQTKFGRHMLDVLQLALSLPGFNLIQTIRKLLSLEQTDWVSAAFMILPVISIEDRSLGLAVDRVKQIVQDNLLRFRSDLIAVRVVAHTVEWTLIICGVVLGFATAWFFVDLSAAGILRLILGILIGLLISCLMMIAGILFSTYLRSSYHTALYAWVRNVEAARQSGEAVKASPPLIISQVLSKHNVPEKEL